MSSYPDTIDALGIQGPSLSALKQQYFEEHEVMPGPEATRELLDKYWEANPPSQESSIQPFSYHTDPDQQQYQQQQYQKEQQHQHGAIEMNGHGHFKLVQRRPDLAPFLGNSPNGIYSYPPPEYHPGAPPAYASAPPALPAMLTPLTEFPFDPKADLASYGGPFNSYVASLHDNGVPFVNSAAPVSGTGVPFVNAAALAPGYGSVHAPNFDGPFITNPSSHNSQADSAPAATVQAPGPHNRPAAVLPYARRRYKAKDQWTQAEIDRVVSLKRKDKTWVQIQEDLGTHTIGSIADKYWYVQRLARGLKK
ncbi:hypothetical protein N0V93_008631 [Gnomoniopsis smithogilvyi]|uniref:Uncharacterized protein n=1 Tax=Gnomoniopsis smithogilvyi TaxID=1191159 RepID=A0A9W8YNK8_9PEZI|nr:hypothetical protein N0V93_008631 [Gnomoniopsis smithogilvyi]